MNRIEKKFKELKRNKQKALVVFITAGYPNLNITRQLILAFAKIGVDIIELGVPFSDPMADGPIIQEASGIALKKGANIGNILQLVKNVRRNTQIPITLMSYYNPVFCFGEERFVKAACESGADGVIIPDLPPEEARPFLNLAHKFNLDTIFFLSPTSSRKRIKLISGASRGFIYYVSLTGVTGPRKALAQGLREHLREIKKITRKPVCVGFGVSSRKQVREILKNADGVIIGSAVIQKIKHNTGKPDLAKRICKFIRTLKE